jgi:hypothetical protein
VRRASASHWPGFVLNRVTPTMEKAKSGFR